MKWFLDLTMRGKLFVCFGLILALMAWVIATGYTGIAAIQESQTRLYQDDLADVRDLLAAMDIFVLPSHSEGMSNTLLEAMASGTPVVASAVGGNTEIVLDRRDGLIFPPDDLEQLHAHLALLCNDEAYRKRLGEAGYARVSQAFGIRAMIARYEQLYDRAAGGIEEARA